SKLKTKLPSPAPSLLGGVAVEYLAAVAALAHLLAVGEESVADARAPVALGADHHDLIGRHRGFLLDDARLAGARAAASVLFDDVHTLYDYFVVHGAHFAHSPALASILAGYHQHRVISLNVHFIFLQVPQYGRGRN